ncbi:MAG: hypothetical protein XD92_0902 [Proteiniphilum acetatigenes]|uniref:Uncharacterized protein n=1 Tax=Proteiniphilum acetatigenes TaxID=294710 RepID=A0A117M069_9BACT|nr:MAG: hypothetical protein XD92_0902 [Proteiniphilum acetatigenes]
MGFIRHMMAWKLTFEGFLFVFLTKTNAAFRDWNHLFIETSLRRGQLLMKRKKKRGVPLNYLIPFASHSKSKNRSQTTINGEKR